MKTAIAILTAALAVSVGGCALHNKPIAGEPTLTPAQRNFDAVWRASLDVLRRYHFPIRRQDRRAGVITTGQTTGKQFFEIWRDDAGTGFHVAENSLQTMYRKATVTVWAKEGQPDVYEAGVTIELVRSDMDSFQVTSTSEAYSIFTFPGGRGSFVVTDEIKRQSRRADDAGQDDSHATPPKGIVPLGRDTALEDRIAGKIADTAGKYLAKSR